MRGVLELPPDLEPLQDLLLRSLERVEDRFDVQVASDLPPVNELCRHIERYRGKMLRPTMAVLCALAGRGGGEASDAEVSEDVVTLAATCEMVHMATLVHDDVLDEADVRRRGETVNRLRGNETAVILGDYLIAAAYHLCSQIADPAVAREAALEIGRTSMVMCAGELLQLHHRDDWSLDEATYFEILDRKTAALVAAACGLGAQVGGAMPEAAGALREFGRRLGVAFQVQDDLLDLTGEEAVVGKSVGKDLEKGKLTLPLIHHLKTCSPEQRGRSLRLMEDAAKVRHDDAAARLVVALRDTGSIEHARSFARRLADDAKTVLAPLPETPAKAMLTVMADAAVARTH